jgi:hypothetical protein
MFEMRCSCTLCGPCGGQTFEESVGAGSAYIWRLKAFGANTQEPCPSVLQLTGGVYVYPPLPGLSNLHTLAHHLICYHADAHVRTLAFTRAQFSMHTLTQSHAPMQRIPASLPVLPSCLAPHSLSSTWGFVRPSRQSPPHTSTHAHVQVPWWCDSYRQCDPRLRGHAAQRVCEQGLWADIHRAAWHGVLWVGHGGRTVPVRPSHRHGVLR